MTAPTFWLSHINYCANNLSLSATGTILLPETNLVDDKPDTLFRSQAASTIDGTQISCLFDEEKPLGVVALINTNLQAGDSVTFAIKRSLAVVAQETVQLHWDTTLGYRADFIWAPPSMQADAIEVTINAPGSPTRMVFDAGELWAGPRWSPATGISLETQTGEVDPTEVAYSRGQQPVINSRVPYREKTLVFPALRESELIGTYGVDAHCLQDIFRRNGSRQNIIVGLVGDGATFSNATNYVVNRLALFGLMSGQLRPQPFDVVSGERVYRASLGVRETR